MKQYPLTDARKQIFLKTLAQTGSVTAAAKAASPHTKCGLSGFRDEARRNPEFAQAVERAKQDALAAVEQELHRRAMNPPKTPILDREGNIRGYREETFSSDKLLLRIASKMDTAWVERSAKDVRVEGTVEHTGGLQLMPQDVLLLSDEDQKTLVRLIETIAERKRTGLDPSKKIEVSDDAE